MSSVEERQDSNPRPAVWSWHPGVVARITLCKIRNNPSTSASYKTAFLFIRYRPVRFCTWTIHGH